MLKVASASDPAVEPGFLHRKMLSEIETADETAGVSAWEHGVWVLNSHFHGPKALRRRLYTFALSPGVVEAAERAGTEFPAQPTPIPFSERRVLADALVPSEIIDEHHAYLYVDETLTPRQLRGDGTDRAQAARIWTPAPPLPAPAPATGTHARRRTVLCAVKLRFLALGPLTLAEAGDCETPRSPSPRHRAPRRHLKPQSRRRRRRARASRRRRSRRRARSSSASRA